MSDDVTISRALFFELFRGFRRYRFLRDPFRASDADHDDFGPAGTVGQIYVAEDYDRATSQTGLALDRAVDQAMALDDSITLAECPEIMRILIYGNQE